MENLGMCQPINQLTKCGSEIGNAKTEPEPQVLRSLAALEQQISIAHDRMADLEVKLRFITHEDVPCDKEKEGVTERKKVEMAITLDRQTNLIRNLYERIDSLICRLEI